MFKLISDGTIISFPSPNNLLIVPRNGFLFSKPCRFFTVLIPRTFVANFHILCNVIIYFFKFVLYFSNLSSLSTPCWEFEILGSNNAYPFLDYFAKAFEIGILFLRISYFKISHLICLETIILLYEDLSVYE